MADEMKNCPFCGLDVNEDEGCFPVRMDRSVWEVRCGNPYCFGHSPDAPTREAAIAKWNRRALSHAAGQDGEQCRAASGDAEIESVIERLAAEAAACITVLGRAPEASDVRVMLDAAKLLRALSRGVPEDAKRLDWVLENAAMVETDGGGQWRVRFDWTAPIMYFSYRDTPRDAIDAAIAAQRKEGE